MVKRFMYGYNTYFRYQEIITMGFLFQLKERFPNKLFFMTSSEGAYNGVPIEQGSNEKFRCKEMDFHSDSKRELRGKKLPVRVAITKTNNDTDIHTVYERFHLEKLLSDKSNKFALVFLMFDSKDYILSVCTNFNEELNVFSSIDLSFIRDRLHLTGPDTLEYYNGNEDILCENFGGDIKQVKNFLDEIVLFHHSYAFLDVSVNDNKNMAKLRHKGFLPMKTNTSSSDSCLFYVPVFENMDVVKLVQKLRLFYGAKINYVHYSTQGHTNFYDECMRYKRLFNFCAIDMIDTLGNFV